MRPAILARSEEQARWRRGLASLLVVYVGWSTTYFAIRLAVREGSGFPPFLMASTRLLAAGLILVLIGCWARSKWGVAAQDWPYLALSALLLWVGGNGLVTWAEQRAHSSYAALIIGSTPMWVAVIEAGLDRRPPSWLLAGSLLTGFGGLVTLAAPTLQHGSPADLAALAALLGATLCWGSGSVLQSRRQFGLDPLASSGLQQLIGGLGLAVLALAVQEPAPQPQPEAWLAWGYLIVFASILTFTAFVQALRLLPTSIVFTYAYVNPVGAALLGWGLLGEEITPWTLAGAALVLTGVAGVFRDRQRRAER